MQELVVGLIAVLIGALLCFRGYAALRLIISLVGAFVGFLLGAGLVAGLTDSGFGQLALSWLVGFVAAVLFGVLAYFSYQVAVVLGMGVIGFSVATSLLASLHVGSPALTLLVGVGAGILLAVLAIATDLPALLLVVLTALSGASIALTGVMIMVGTISSRRLDGDAVLAAMATSWWWYALYIGLAALGLVAQGRHLARGRRTMRQQWAGSNPAPVPAH